MSRTDPVTLTNCDREPIHIPGTIQSHGCLVACDAQLRVVKRHSVNVRDFLPAAGDIDGVPLESLLGGEITHQLRNALIAATDPSRPALVTAARLDDGTLLDVAVHQFKGNAIVEFERTDSTDASLPLQLARKLISRLKAETSANRILTQTPRLIRTLLGYDRVMIYRFAHDGSGEVISEAKREHLESFLGQRFPASDIPRQARELYLRNTIRVIVDADGVSVPVLPALDGSGEPLDLSFAHLRSVSPIHCEYLRNMGVSASMSLSIIAGGKLWGLIACHHYEPRTLSMAERVAAEMFGDFFSLTLDVLHHKSLLDTALKARHALDGLLREVAYHSDVDAFLRERLSIFSTIVPCDGVALWANGTWTASGLAPPRSLVPSLARFVNTTSEGRIWATHEIRAHMPSFEDVDVDVAGVLAVPISQMPRDYLFLFRKEVVETVNWAGNPNKQYEVGPLGDRLTPRKSFAIWKETVEGQSLPWTMEDREAAESVRTALLEVIMRQTELLAAERRKADVRQKILNEELNHRVKNILALIKSLVTRPVQDGQTLEGYVAALRGRIVALAYAHDQVVRSDGGGALRGLLEAELSPYRGGVAEITLEGPELGLDARAYSVMALVIHEMATNAAKYGALSTTGGMLTVRWNCEDRDGCEITWIESGGPTVTPPSRRGFGTVLVDRSVPYDLSGESELNFEPGGVSARFFIPRKFVSSLAPCSDERKSAPAPAQAIPTAVSALKILLVEDQLLIAMDVETALTDAGVKTMRTAATAAEALKMIAIDQPDAAILDVNLGSGTSIPVAEELMKRGVPFIFATGYGDSAHIPRSLAKVPVLRKPYDADTLIVALAAIAPPPAAHCPEEPQGGSQKDGSQKERSR
jgi:light-regulated signal transduction histidine kinase (bacteriophytochrome)/CheY-like chemotaxis protein